MAGERERARSSSSCRRSSSDSSSCSCSSSSPSSSDDDGRCSRLRFFLGFFLFLARSSFSLALRSFLSCFSRSFSSFFLFFSSKFFSALRSRGFGVRPLGALGSFSLRLRLDAAVPVAPSSPSPPACCGPAPASSMNSSRFGARDRLPSIFSATRVSAIVTSWMTCCVCACRSRARICMSSWRWCSSMSASSRCLRLRCFISSKSASHAARRSFCVSSTHDA
mmetsp:Transcript_14944/g.35144  ORF Transcript_14944/g.35144 Transcript_14944/m.35144 type:complete len:222 (-) Transcript_14944:126-791(-)